MNKKNLSVIIGIVIVVILALVLVQQGVFKKPSGEGIFPMPGTTGSQDGQAQSPEEIDKILRAAVGVLNISTCQQIKEEEDRKRCQNTVILGQASAEQNPKICNQLEDEPSQIYCKDNIFLNQAINTKNPSYCDQITDKTKRADCKGIVSSLK